MHSPLRSSGIYRAVDFVFRNGTLPRSVQFCLDGIRRELQGLRNHREAERVLDRLRRKLKRFNPETASREDLHRFIDRFQLDLNLLNNVINETWFYPDEA